MNREVHVRIWERPEVRLLRATRRTNPSAAAAANGRNREGFRMPARRERLTQYKAGVGKPPKKEPAGKR
jgi:hypothetical protein